MSDRLRNGLGTKANGHPKGVAILRFRGWVREASVFSFLYGGCCSDRAATGSGGRRPMICPLGRLDNHRASIMNFVRNLPNERGDDDPDRWLPLRSHPLYSKGLARKSTQLFLPYVPAPFGGADPCLGQLSQIRGGLGWAGRCACAVAIIAGIAARVLPGLRIDLGRCGRCAHDRIGNGVF